jgi:D-sedoheptulose 7-phosphate isomerase
MPESNLTPPFLPQTFVEAADGLYQASDRLAQHLNVAAQAVVHSLTSGGKILCAGQGPSAWLARHTAQLLLGGTGRPRPALAALCVAADGNPGQSARDGHMEALVRALAHPGDVWLACSLEGDEGELARATEAASEMDLTLVILSGEAATVLGPMVRETDVWVPLPGKNSVQLFGAAWLAVHGLNDAVDAHLLVEDL